MANDITNEPVQDYGRVGAALRKLVVRGALALGSSPSITASSGTPTAAENAGSLHLSTAGGLYARISTTWYQIVGAAGALVADVISERTSAAGVTVDGVLLKDGGMTAVGAITTTDGIASGTARRVGGVAYVSTAASTAITGTTETETLFSTQYSLPANSLSAGSVIRVRAQGIHTATTGSETHSIILKIGSVAVCTIAAVDPADNDIFWFDATIVCRTNGATGTIVAAGTAMAAAATAAGDAAPFFLASTTLDTTGANIIGVAIDRQATATDSDSARLDVLVVEVIG